MVKPLVTREMRERARRVPNNWLHVIDPAHDSAADVPAEAVIGRYLVDARGEITDQYVPNPRYQPREVTFENDLESVMYLVQRGYGDKQALVDAVLAADLVLPADPAREPRRHLVMRGDTVDVFASEQARPRDWPPHWHRFRGVELAVVVDALDRPVTLLVTAQGGVQFEIPGDLLVEGLRDVITMG
ncbi:type VII secretion system-associated protein [Lentzea sp. HUAS12]|uniref:type VII secretion system-associated protein n=1 Tax=Lentzea sp. HUAS12 TaxID=2951806 RepID=UPI0020A194C2|nr:type VII secretion system-associated protein [Lentzea sp. HUAS12]USX48762.1 type VII secretion system-associated protein [Lentzea sp. HUAS12]